MQLKRYTDYALRVLLYLGSHPDQVISVNRIAQAYGISRNHLLKVIGGLTEQRLIDTFRGQHGGLRLASAPEDINIGAVVAHMEGDSPLVNCIDPPCPILPACQLNHALREARQAFIDHLSRYTLADLLHGRQQQLVRLLTTA
jgi:Rrf2 family nitric oxide-sensitive transcriptional repressor